MEFVWTDMYWDFFWSDYFKFSSVIIIIIIIIIIPLIFLIDSSVTKHT